MTSKKPKIQTQIVGKEGSKSNIFISRDYNLINYN